MPKLTTMTGDELRAWRKAQGWTQAQAARAVSEALGLAYSQGRWSDFENGSRAVPRVVALYVRTQEKEKS